MTQPNTTDTANAQQPSIHMGRGIQVARELKNWTQEALAQELGADWNQKKISNLEKKQTIDEPTLLKVADALKVDVNDLRNYKPSTSMSVTNNFSDQATAHGFGFGADFDKGNTHIVNDIKEIVAMFKEQTEQIQNLYERMLEQERDRRK